MTFFKKTHSKRLLAGFLFAATLVFFVGLIGVYSSLRISQSLEQFENETIQEIITLQEIRSSFSLMSIEDILSELVGEIGGQFDRNPVEALVDAYFAEHGRAYLEAIINGEPTLPVQMAVLRMIVKERRSVSSPAETRSRIEEDISSSPVETRSHIAKNASSSPVAIDTMGWRWKGVVEVPERREIPEKEGFEVAFVPVEEGIIEEKVLYLFWKVWALQGYLQNWLAGLFEALKNMMEKISGILRKIAEVMTPQTVTIPLRHSERSEESQLRFFALRAQNDKSEMTFAYNQASSSVGAVVASSSVPVSNRKGGLTQVKIDSFASMLNPNVGGYDSTVNYLAKQFIRGGLWEGQTDMVASSPLWVDVINRAKEMDGTVEITQAAEKPKAEMVIAKINKEMPPPQEAVHVPSRGPIKINHAEVPVDGPEISEEANPQTIQDFSPYRKTFLDFIWRLFNKFIAWLRSIDQGIAKVMYKIRGVIVPVWYVPEVANVVMSERSSMMLGNQLARWFRSRQHSAVVVTSSSIVKTGKRFTPEQKKDYESMLRPGTNGIEATEAFLAKQFVKGPWQGQTQMIASSPIWAGVVAKIEEMGGDVRERKEVRSEKKRQTGRHLSVVGRQPPDSEQLHETTEEGQKDNVIAFSQRQKRPSHQKPADMPQSPAEIIPFDKDFRKKKPQRALTAQKVQQAQRSGESQESHVEVPAVDIMGTLKHYNLQVREGIITNTYTKGVTVVPIILPAWMYMLPRMTIKTFREKLSDNVIEKNDQPVQKAKRKKAVTASVSSMDRDSLNNLVWLNYLEQKPKKGRALIKRALEAKDYDALSFVRGHRKEYPRLNDLIDQLEGKRVPKKKRRKKVAMASVSSMSRESLKDPVWLRHFEKEPKKARVLIEEALKDGDVDALSVIRRKRRKYRQLNIFIDHIESGMISWEKQEGRAVMASISPMDRESLKDTVWLDYLEDNPEKARPLIERVLKARDFDALAFIRENPGRYEDLNALIDEMGIEMAWMP